MYVRYTQGQNKEYLPGVCTEPCTYEASFTVYLYTLVVWFPASLPPVIFIQAQIKMVSGSGAGNETNTLAAVQSHCVIAIGVVTNLLIHLIENTNLISFILLVQGGVGIFPKYSHVKRKQTVE